VNSAHADRPNRSEPHLDACSSFIDDEGWNVQHVDPTLEQEHSRGSGLNAPTRPDLTPTSGSPGGWSPKAKRNAVILAVVGVVGIIAAASAGPSDSSTESQPATSAPITYSPNPPEPSEGGGGGPVLTRVPHVNGLRLSVARSQLKNSELRIQIKKKSSSQTPGTVLSQRPASGARVRENKSVMLVVAKPRPEPPTTASGGGGGWVGELYARIR
jgi:PASTA domain